MSRFLARLLSIMPVTARWLSAAMLVLAGLAPAGANPAPSPLPGADAPAFDAALDLWLADDENAALVALASLAGEGNGAARLLLGLIDKTPALQGPFLARLAREDRIALLRAPGGMSGRNWLAEMPQLPLARAWLDLWSVASGPEVIDAFSALAEDRAAREALVVLAAREHPGLAALAPDSVAPDLLYLLWTAADSDRRAQIAARVPPDHPQRQLMAEQVAAADLERWLATSPLAAPVATLCAQVCPGDEAACRIAAYRALNSHNALVTMGTPAETLIGQARFLNSPRGRASVLRRILLSVPMNGRRSMLARVETDTACLATALREEAERYRPYRPVVQISE